LKVVWVPLPLLDTDPPDPPDDIELEKEPPAIPAPTPWENKSAGANKVAAPKAVIGKKRLIGSPAYLRV
jgi:hypothetical protein